MFPIYHLEKCASTNDEILKFLKENQQNLALYTFNQTNGRGQYGNIWESTQHQNLAYSLAVESSAFQISGSLFNFYTAMMVRDFLAKLTQNEVFVKWPNDIIIQCKKVAGMLIERKKIGNTEFYILGIGINILQKNFVGLAKAGSILTQTKQQFELENVVNQLHEFLTSQILKPISEGLILNHFNQNLFKKDQISVFEIKGLRQNGIIKFADEQGFLWIDLEEDGLQKFYHKEIELLY